MTHPSYTILHPPFPWFGGKYRWAPTINAMLGTVDIYVEPFAGSLAVLLARPPADREIVCDTNGYIVNFWRAMQADAEAVAVNADYPTFHDDLTARHRWLIEWGEKHFAKLRDDPLYYDTLVAGWWAWGQSNWIGSGFCVTFDDGKIPSIPGARRRGGRGVNAQRLALPEVAEHMPSGDPIPMMNSDIRGGIGVSVGRRRLMSDDGGIHGSDNIGTGERLLPWFRALAQRLAKVTVLNRSWESAVTPSVLSQVPSSPPTSVGILLDPPYLSRGRTRMYQSDADGVTDEAAIDAYEWAIEYGTKYRIAYCCRTGDFEVPPGWETRERGFKGIKVVSRRVANKDMVMFSPACLDDHTEQYSFF